MEIGIDLRGAASEIPRVMANQKNSCKTVGLILLASSLPFVIGASSTKPYSSEALPAASNVVGGNLVSNKLDAAKIIVEQMAPIIISSSNEAAQCCFPGDPIFFWKSRSILCDRNPSATFDPDQKAWVPGLHSEWIGQKSLPLEIAELASVNQYVTQAKKKPFPKELDRAAPCYCEWYFDDPYLQVKYWMWWSFNDHPNDSILNPFDHEGDWEHIELRARLEDTENFRYVYFFNRHGEPKIVLPQYWATVDGKRVSHPKVWIAEGSHAPYESPNLSENLDNVEDSELIINTSENLRFRVEGSVDPVWSFHGKWGAMELTPTILGKRATDPPVGPAVHSRFENSDGRQEFP
jgi:hypothetical protein